MRLKSKLYAESIDISKLYKLNESPDETCNGLTIDDYDAIPFGFIIHNNKTYCVIGNYEDYHNNMYRNAEFNPEEIEEIEDINVYRRVTDGSGMIKKKLYLYAGRYWYKSNIISFYEMPPKNELVKYIKILANKVYKYYVDIRTYDVLNDKHTPVKIDFNTLQIEIPKNKKTKTKEHLELLSDYLGNEIEAEERSREELIKQHTDPKMRDQKKKDLFDKGFMGGSKKNQLKYPESKPEDIMRQKQAMYAESIQLDNNYKLYENPDTTKIKIDDTDILLRVTTKSAYPFALGNKEGDEKGSINICAFGEESTYHEHSSEELIDLMQGNTGVPIIVGRLWLKYKILSTYTNVSDEDFDIMIKLLSNKLGENILNDEWKISIYTYKDNGEIAQKHKRQMYFTPEQRPKEEIIIPIKCYKNYPYSMKDRTKHSKYDKYKPEDVLAWKQAKLRSESSESFESIYNKYNNILNEAKLRGEPLTPEELRKLLHQKVLNFEFIKKSGEHRKAKGTTVMKKIPADSHPKGEKPSSPNVVPFYDLKKHDWRSVSVTSPEIVQSPSFLQKTMDLFKRKEIEVEPKEIDKEKLSMPKIDLKDIDSVETIPTKEPDTTPEEIIGEPEEISPLEPISPEEIISTENIIKPTSEPIAKPSTIIPADDVLQIPSKPIIKQVNVYDEKPESPIKTYIDRNKALSNNDLYNAQKIEAQYITPDSAPEVKTIYNTTPEEEISKIENNLISVINKDPIRIEAADDTDIPSNVTPIKNINNIKVVDTSINI